MNQEQNYFNRYQFVADRLLPFITDSQYIKDDIKHVFSILDREVKRFFTEDASDNHPLLHKYFLSASKPGWSLVNRFWSICEPEDMLELEFTCKNNFYEHTKKEDVNINNIHTVDFKISFGDFTYNHKVDYSKGMYPALEAYLVELNNLFWTIFTDKEDAITPVDRFLTDIERDFGKLFLSIIQSEVHHTEVETNVKVMDAIRDITLDAFKIAYQEQDYILQNKSGMNKIDIPDMLIIRVDVDDSSLYINANNRSIMVNKNGLLLVNNEAINNSSKLVIDGIKAIVTKYLSLLIGE